MALADSTDANGVPGDGWEARVQAGMPEVPDFKR